jgi:ABC-2 type transport system ATP-binding protein
MAAILATDVAKRYGRGSKAVQALDGVTVQVEQGEIYGLLGRNGAGKTTLVKVLLDIVRASAGEAQILGLSSRQARARRQVGYLPEDHRFPLYQTGESALHFYASLSGVPRKGRPHRVAELLDLVGLSQAGRQKIRAYSKGMKQRLGLAQALIHDPTVLFLDEPTDGVDPVGRADIRGTLERLREEGKTIFLNSHLLSEVEQICDRVGMLEKGNLARQGTVQELTQADLSFQIQTTPEVDDALLAELNEWVVFAKREPGGLEIGLEEEGEIDRVVDLLRARSIGIRSLIGKRLSLEQVFLESVQSESES